MDLTKYGHACVALSKDGRRLVIDPGAFTEDGVIGDAEAVLVTHEHPDHLSVEALDAAWAQNPELRVWTTAAVAEVLGDRDGRVTAVTDGDTFTAAGFDVTAVGEWHAVIHPDVPRMQNVGFVVDGTVFHPGDAFTMPGRPVETLLTPAHAPWSKLQEIIDWVRAVSPVRTVSVHDGALNDRGLGLVNRMLGAGGPGTGAQHLVLASGETVRLP
ncbi:MBL fold metallo-hydrolase [Sanguibacter sp. 4.1]|uniref:MBL fold metallo-hydrolase n=1 Tax=Sanguibacter biliveldensis TaxID=3030830 RepID=A0AAF0Z8L8_9MICO|nr:MBL fold metallo-hydrolase [Sanguibacter sp. 4.1]WPF82153.1 MBL fold metallo-hydrolase [Sanguibacter sp. 4.1]